MAILSGVRPRSARNAAGCLLLAGVLVLVSGCGGGDSGPDARDAAPKTSAPNGPPPAGSASGTESADDTDAADEPDESAESSAEFWADKADVALFLCRPADPRVDGCAGGAVTNTQREAVKDDLQRMPEIRDVYYESKADAFRRVKDDPNYAAIAASVTPDQMPDAFRVKLTGPDAAPTVLSAFQGRPGVQSVVVSD